MNISNYKDEASQNCQQFRRIGIKWSVEHLRYSVCGSFPCPLHHIFPCPPPPSPHVLSPPVKRGSRGVTPEHSRFLLCSVACVDLTAAWIHKPSSSIVVQDDVLTFFSLNPCSTKFDTLFSVVQSALTPFIAIWLNGTYLLVELKEIPEQLC